MLFLQNYLAPDEADGLLNWCINNETSCWRQETFSIYGRTVTAPRWLTWFGEKDLNYRYSGIDHVATGWPDQLRTLRDAVSCEAGCSFNFLLLNRYDHGGHYMGWHRDDESAAAPQIASLSLGGTRRFRYRQGPGERSTAIDLTSGSLLMFDGRLQHTLTKTARRVPLRINLTFRQVAATPAMTEIKA
jgi:alkylated DNA repair dioxygenase AlkB